MKMSIRKPAVAGKFYPGEKKVLEEMIETLLLSAKKYEIKKPKIGIVPHAGYVFSGRTAAHFYKAIEDFSYENIILIGPAHFYPIENAIASSFSFWQTPLGKVPVEKEINRYLGLPVLDPPFVPEHSLEVQLPFLQYVYQNKNLKIFPIHINEYSLEFAKKLLDFVEKNYYDSLILISSDLSHYFPEDQAVHIDKHSLKIILKKEIGKISEIDACGQAGIGVGLYLAYHLDLTPKLLFYDTSASAFGDTSAVVGYASIGFY